MSVLRAQKDAVREVLGSAPIAKLSARRIAEVDARRAAREERRRLDAERRHVIDELERALGLVSEQALASQRAEATIAAKGQGRRDYRAVLRGGCEACLQCANFVKPAGLGPFHRYSHHCVACGCPAARHEERRSTGVVPR